MNNFKGELHAQPLVLGVVFLPCFHFLSALTLVVTHDSLLRPMISNATGLVWFIQKEPSSQPDYIKRLEGFVHCTVISFLVWALRQWIMDLSFEQRYTVTLQFIWHLSINRSLHEVNLYQQGQTLQFSRHITICGRVRLKSGGNHLYLRSYLIVWAIPPFLRKIIYTLSQDGITLYHR